MCPARCRCNDDVLRASCIAAGLEVVPIQLNPDVQHMDLSKNRITNVHFTLSFYSNLVSLDLSSNKIQTLGSGNFESQNKLKVLNLSNNKVEFLSKDSLKGLKNLTELDLSFNHLEELSVDSFHDLHSLQVMKLPNNRMVYLEAGIMRPVKELKELYLNDNQLLEVPGPAIADALNLQLLALSRNLLVSVEDGGIPALPELRVLLLDSNIISELHVGAFSGLGMLQHLDLSDNNFTAIPTAPLAKLSNLTTLQFSRNLISSVPPVAFRGLFQLRHLYLNSLDFLTHIDPRAFVDNIDLEKVWLDENLEITKLPTRLFHGNPKLADVSIRNNQITTLEVSHFPLDQLKFLRLGGNPFQCNCSLLWLWRLEQEQKHLTENSTVGDLYIDTEEIRCAGPEGLTDVLLVDATESQVDCSLGWIAVVSGILLCFVLVGTVSTLMCLGPMKRRLKRAHLPIPAGDMAPKPAVPPKEIVYQEPHVDKYIMGPSLIADYRGLPPWDVFSDNTNIDIYRQFDAHVKTRPHIVYV